MGEDRDHREIQALMLSCQQYVNEGMRRSGFIERGHVGVYEVAAWCTAWSFQMGVLGQKEGVIDDVARVSLLVAVAAGKVAAHFFGAEGADDVIDLPVPGSERN